MPPDPPRGVGNKAGAERPAGLCGGVAGPTRRLLLPGNSGAARLRACPVNSPSVSAGLDRRRLQVLRATKGRGRAQGGSCSWDSLTPSEFAPDATLRRRPLQWRYPGTCNSGTTKMRDQVPPAATEWPWADRPPGPRAP